MKSRQRGFGIIDFVMYAAIALAALGFVAGVNSALKHHYVDPEKVEWDKAKAVLNRDIEVHKGNEAACRASNVTLKKDFDEFREKKNKEVEDAKTEAEKAKANRAARDKANAPRVQQNSMELFNMITSLGKPDGGLSCDQLDAVLLEEAKRRQKFYGPAEPMPVQPNTSGLRIAEPPTERPKPLNPLVRPK